jgi:hypothetical protein
MTDLSPAAQAVLDAANKAYDQAGTVAEGTAAACVLLRISHMTFQHGSKETPTGITGMARMPNVSAFLLSPTSWRASNDPPRPIPAHHRLCRGVRP